MQPAYTRRDYLKLLGATMVASQLGGRRAPAASPQGAPPSPKEDLRGIFVILATPYTDAKAIDYDDLAGQVDWLTEAGVQGMVWPQNSSDYSRLTRDEIMRGMEVLAKAHTGRPSVLVFGVQQDDTRGMVELAKYAENLAPDMLLAMPPKVARSADDYRAYYGELARLTSRPVMIQTIPNPSGVEFTTELVLELATRHPNLGYVKEEEQPVFDRIEALVARRPTPIKRVYSARRGRAWPYELRLGSDGTVNGASMYADVFVRSWTAYRAGNWDEVREIHSKVLLMLMCEEAIPGANRYLLKRRGIFKSTATRQRDSSMSPSQIAEVEHNLKALEPYMRRRPTRPTY